MTLENQLEIIIPTYNRKNYLQHTLSRLLEEKSPVKNVSITVLDNHSTDGTAEYVEQLSARYPNVKHVRHAINIGGNANIAYAFTIVQKEYYWLLADDDDYDFSHWDKVEKAMRQASGLIVVNRELLPAKESVRQAFLLRLLTFMPAAIHRKDTLTPEIMINIYYNISNWFPHFAAVCAAFNKKLPICVLEENIVTCGKNSNHEGLEFHRVTPGIAQPFKMRFFEVCYLASLSLLEDRCLRWEACEYFLAEKKSFFLSVLSTFKKNMIEYQHSLRNISDPLPSLSNWQRIRFLLAILCNYLLFILLYPKFVIKRKKFIKRLELANKNTYDRERTTAVIGTEKLSKRG